MAFAHFTQQCTASTSTRGRIQAMEDRDRIQGRLTQLKTIKKLREQQVTYRQRFESGVQDHNTAGLQRAVNRQIYVTPAGKVWHSSIKSLQPKHQPAAMRKQPCQIRGALCASFAASSPDRRSQPQTSFYRCELSAAKHVSHNQLL